MEIKITLLSDTTFGRGDGVSGLVDQEVEHDPFSGLPLLRGRTLKGLLVEACADIFYSLERAGKMTEELRQAAAFLFGEPGSDLEADAGIRIGAAQLPQLLRAAVTADVRARRLTPADVLESLTAIRRQTAVDEVKGRPEDKSLRSMRVLIRGTELAAPVTVSAAWQPDQETALALLAACVAGVRRGGIGRNRGRGHLQARLWHDGQDQTAQHLAQFRQLIGATS